MDNLYIFLIVQLLLYFFIKIMKLIEILIIVGVLISVSLATQ